MITTIGKDLHSENSHSLLSSGGKKKNMKDEHQKLIQPYSSSSYSNTKESPRISNSDGTSSTRGNHHDKKTKTNSKITVSAATKMTLKNKKDPSLSMLCCGLCY